MDALMKALKNRKGAASIKEKVSPEGMEIKEKVALKGPPQKPSKLEDVEAMMMESMENGDAIEEEDDYESDTDVDLGVAPPMDEDFEVLDEEMKDVIKKLKAGQPPRDLYEKAIAQKLGINYENELDMEDEE